RPQCAVGIPAHIQADHIVAGGGQHRHQHRTEVSLMAGGEYAHGGLPSHVKIAGDPHGNSLPVCPTLALAGSLCRIVDTRLPIAVPTWEVGDAMTHRADPVAVPPPSPPQDPPPPPAAELVDDRPHDGRTVRGAVLW